jgi:hypothetical protein
MQLSALRKSLQHQQIETALEVVSGHPCTPILLGMLSLEVKGCQEGGGGSEESEGSEME